MQICGGLDVKCFRLLKCSFHVRFGFHRKKTSTTTTKKKRLQKGRGKECLTVFHFLIVLTFSCAKREFYFGFQSAKHVIQHF